jgi:hypothetical protein
MLVFNSGTIASTRFPDNATIGARSSPNQTAHSLGSVVSNPTHSIATSPPGMPAAGSIFVICPALPI